MGKYDIMMKCAQVRSLANEKQYRNAYEVLQTLNIDQITSIADLNTIADVLIQLQKYADAKDVYLKLYNKIPNRRVLYQLVYLSLKCGDIEGAEDYYGEYKELDKSIDRIILRYYIDKAKGVSRQTLITYLQELKKEEYMEEWAYELAKLYHKEGMREECIQECSDIALWFGEGLIVEKALLLKHHYLDGADISSEKAIMEETRNLAAELKIAAAIAEKNEREQAQLEEQYAYDEPEEYTEEPYTDEETEDMEDEYEDEVLEEDDINSLYTPEELEEMKLAYKEAVLRVVQRAEKELMENTGSMATVQETVNAAAANTETPVAEMPDMVTLNSEVPVAEEQTYEEQTYEEETLAEEPSGIEREIAEIVRDIKKGKEPGHIAITGEESDKNIEIGKYLAKELYKQQVLPTSKIARITAERLNEVSLEENYQKLVGGCLLIEEASGLSLDSVQSLYQFIHKAKGSAVVIFSDTEKKIDDLLKKNRKLGKLVEYHIEL